MLSSDELKFLLQLIFKYLLCHLWFHFLSDSHRGDVTTSGNNSPGASICSDSELPYISYTVDRPIGGIYLISIMEKSVTSFYYSNKKFNFFNLIPIFFKTTIAFFLVCYILQILPNIRQRIKEWQRIKNLYYRGVKWVCRHGRPNVPGILLLLNLRQIHSWMKIYKDCRYFANKLLDVWNQTNWVSTVDYGLLISKF